MAAKTSDISPTSRCGLPNRPSPFYERGVNRNIPPSTGRPEAELSWQPAPGLDFTVSSRFTRFVITSMVKETAFESDKATFVSDEAMFESNETTFESSETTVASNVTTFNANVTTFDPEEASFIPSYVIDKSRTCAGPLATWSSSSQTWSSLT